MKSMFLRSYGLTSGIALWLSTLPLSGYADEKAPPANVVQDTGKALQEYSLNHTVNFNNISIVEVIRFVSKITGYNFVFATEDLGFNVTIISEEPMSTQNIMTSLVQVLRIHGLKMLEQDDNFMITRVGSGANQVPDIVIADSGSSNTKSPIITRIFRVKNTPLSTLVDVLQPMLSNASLIEVVPQTNQLIITDVTTNVDKIATLLAAIDVPLSNLSIESYTIQHMGSDLIIPLAQKILAPFLGGNPLILVPQKETNTIFVISTPHLIEQAISVLEDLDVESKASVVGHGAMETFVYKILHQRPEVLIQDLKTIASQTQNADPNLVQAIQTSNYIASAGTIVFLTDTETWTKLKALLEGIDSTAAPISKPTFWMYKVEKSTPDKITAALKQLSSTIQDPSLQETISSAQWIAQSNSFLFTGPESAINRLQEILPGLDVADTQPSLYTYKIEKATDDQMMASLSQIANTSKDADLVSAIRGVQMISGTHTLVFNASATTTAKLQSLMPSLDVVKGSGPQEMYLYKVKGNSLDELESAINDLLPSIEDPELQDVIQTMKPILDKHTLMFSGSKEAIVKLEKILPSLDTTSYSKQLFLYTLQKGSHQQVLHAVEKMAKTSKDKNLLAAVSTAQWIEESNTLVFHTSPDEIAKLQEILPTLDVPKASSLKQIYVYKTQAAIEGKIQSALEQVAKASQDPQLIETIRSMQWVPESQTFVFQGSEASLKEVKDLLSTIDIKDGRTEPFIYKIQKGSEEHIVSLLKQLAASSEDKNLVHAVKTMQWIKQSQTLIFNGTPEAISRLQALLPELDTGDSSLQTYLYPLRKASQEKMKESLDLLAASSKDEALIQAINSASWVEESHTFIFQGTKKAIVELEKILPTFDVSRSALTRLYIYRVDPASVSQLKSALEQIAASSDDAGLKEMVKTVQWSKPSSSLIFQGSDQDIAQLKDLLQTVDLSSSKLELYVYKIQKASEAQIANALQQMADSLQNKDFIEAVASMQYLQDSNSLIFHASNSAIEKLKSVLPSLDVANNAQIYVYKLQNISYSKLQDLLEDLANKSDQQAFKLAIDSMQWVPESRTFIFHATPPVIAELQSLLPSLDVKGSNEQIYTYKTRNPSPAYLAAALQQMETTTQDKGLIEAIKSMHWIAESKTFVFQGSPEAIAKLQALVPSLDTQTEAPASQMYMYTLQKASQGQLLSTLEQMAQKSGDTDFINAVDDVQWIPSSRTLVFNTLPSVIAKLESILPTLDVTNGPVLQMYMYKPQIASKDKILSALDMISETTQDKDLASAINSVKWIDESHAFIFNGTAATITQLQSILPSLDSVSPPTLSAISSKGQFFLYSPKYQSADSLQQAITDLIDNLKGSGLQNNNFLMALESMKWVPTSNSLIFTGDADSLQRIQTILSTLDVQNPNTVQSFFYKPVYASETQLQSALMQFAQGLDPVNISDQKLAQAIYQMQWNEANRSFTFKASPETIERLQKTLVSLDSPQGLSSLSSTGFFIYKLQYAQGKTIIANLINLAGKLPAADPNTMAITKAIQNIKWIEDNNSLMISGSPYIIDQIKSLVAEFDTSSAAPKVSKADLFMYKPFNKTPDQLVHSLLELAKDLKKESFSDPELIQCLESAKAIPGSQSVLFTASPNVIAKVQTLLPAIDTKSSEINPIQLLGENTFLIYKIKQASHEELMHSLETFAHQLGKGNIADQMLVKSLLSAKWIQETNSLMFTGPQETLRKVEGLAEKFDLSSKPPPAPPKETPATFTVYTPKVQRGADLIGVLNDFVQNLKQAGICDPSLFETVSHLRYIDKTNSLIISGDPAAIQRVEELLSKFDVPGSEEKPQIDASNFLIYKLQYHQGVDIQYALKQVATSLSKSSAQTNAPLINAIDSLQWVEVTNSLLGTGDPDTLARIRQLIANLDVPLRQVFIEVLVVQTTLFNSQNFGLQWGSQFQYLNKTVGAMGNFPSVMNNNVSNSSNQPPGTLSLSNPISFTTNTSPPIQGNPAITDTGVPFSTGFDLGVIGDIIFHKGQSFISMGNLVNALQVDNDSTVVMNPKIVTQDGRTSSIFVGQNIPFVGSFVSNSASNTVQSSNIEYRNIGVNLVITPTLGTNNIITLDISQDISQQTPNTTNVQGSQVTGIQTSLTTMNTRVHVPDRHFLVLSGMIQDSKTHFRSSIPCLGGLPVIGALFGENDRANSKSNVIIFLRPFIIDSFKDYDQLTADQEGLYKEQAGLQDLKEEFDAGVEMIKDLHND